MFRFLRAEPHTSIRKLQECRADPVGIPPVTREIVRHAPEQKLTLGSRM